MEIALLYKNCLRIKGKRATFVVDPSKQDKVVYNAAMVVAQPAERLYVHPDTVVIEGPGEYEIAGVKMSAINDGAIVYNLVVDGVEIYLGKISSFEKMQHKLKEQHVVIAYADSMLNASFVTSLSTNVIIFYGDRATELAASIGKEKSEAVGKYSITHDKLPQVVETVVLE